MKKSRISHIGKLLTICLLAMAFNVTAQQLAFGRLNALDKGCNLSNWLESFWFPEDQYPPSGLYNQADIQAMNLAGMNNVRLNVNFERFLDNNPPYLVDFEHEAFAWIDSVIQWTIEEEMMVVLCNQHGWDDLNDFTFSDVAPRILALWNQLALKYKDYDASSLLFEIINEPPSLLSRSKTRMLMEMAVHTIRNHSVDHTIVVSGSLGSHASELPNTTPIADTNVIYTFHYYEPFYFTHQGATWTPIFFPIGATFPNNFLNDENVMRNHFQRIDNWRQIHDVPVYLGELGTINFGDEGSKCNWIGLMGELIDQYDMNWSFWDCKYSEDDNFGFFDGDTISPLHIRPCYRQALHLYDDGLPTALITEQLEQVSIAPNPASDHIAVGGLGEEYFDVDIFDAVGRPVLNLKGVYDRSQIVIAQLPPGVYLLTFSQDSRLKGMARLIKSH